MSALSRSFVLGCNFADRFYQDELKEESLKVRRHYVSSEVALQFSAGCLHAEGEKSCFETVRNISISCALLENKPFLFENI